MNVHYRGGSHLALEPVASEFEVKRPAEPVEVAQGQRAPVEEKVQVDELVRLYAHTEKQWNAIRRRQGFTIFTSAIRWVSLRRERDRTSQSGRVMLSIGGKF